MDFVSPNGSNGGGAATGSRLSWDTVNGSLLCFQPTKVIEQMETQYGPKDAVNATVTVCDGDEAGTVYDDVLVFPTNLVRQLRENVGRNVLGRLTRQQGKNGSSWVLADNTQEERAAASAVMDGSSSPNSDAPPF